MKKTGRITVCQESKEGLKVSTKAEIKSQHGGGFSIKMSNQYGSDWVRTGGKKIAVYPTIVAAERTVLRHNKVLKPIRPKASPPPNLCPPKS